MHRGALSPSGTRSSNRASRSLYHRTETAPGKELERRLSREPGSRSNEPDYQPTTGLPSRSSRLGARHFPLGLAALLALQVLAHGDCLLAAWLRDCWLGQNHAITRQPPKILYGGVKSVKLATPRGQIVQRVWRPRRDSYPHHQRKPQQPTLVGLPLQGEHR